MNVTWDSGALGSGAQALEATSSPGLREGQSCGPTTHPSASRSSSSGLGYLTPPHHSQAPGLRATPAPPLTPPGGSWASFSERTETEGNRRQIHRGGVRAASRRRQAEVPGNFSLWLRRLPVRITGPKCYNHSPLMATDLWTPAPTHRDPRRLTLSPHPAPRVSSASSACHSALVARAHLPAVEHRGIFMESQRP